MVDVIYMDSIQHDGVILERIEWYQKFLELMVLWLMLYTWMKLVSIYI